ncbi:hypothetical protein F4778DRAFT_582739 [Xylariomycetidae sp. FL2044]|nr:hypothetical protein F4778DRAFT_582739 [Xylariomycetidae sp. FL2044]
MAAAPMATRERLASRAYSNASSTELTRHHDVNKYYQPWQNAIQLGTVPPNTGPGGHESLLPKPSPDITLTALAQLAALRLNAKRGMVSLIDTNTQIILAEATQTLSLVDQGRHAPGDHVWLGHISLPREDCMDEHAFGATTTCANKEGEPVQMSAFVVNDTLEDDRFKARPYVTAGMAVRFYAGVPIITKDGQPIGVYAISDSHPRPDGLTYDQLQFMEDVACIVAEHLQRVLDTSCRVSERDFMRGVSQFLEDLSEYKHKLSASSSKAQVKRSPTTTSDVRATDPQATPMRGRRRESEDTSQLTYSPTRSSASSSRDRAGARRSPLYSTSDGSSGAETFDPSQDNVRKVFTQASRVLCKQAKSSGCVFADASAGLFSGSFDAGVSSRSRGPGLAAVGDFGVSEEEDDNDQGIGGSTDHSFTDTSGEAPHTSLEDAADILSVAVAKGEIFERDSINRETLKKCILRYPFGKCFHLERGKVASSDRPEVSDRAITGGGSTRAFAHTSYQGVEDHPRKILPREFLDNIPDAKWLIFLPLFNYARGQWFAAGFIWGNEFGSGDPDDALPYFKTFGSCMMSEVVSMEVLTMNIAKSTFIASMSHDLRSPLHGILGSLEFLEQTQTSAYQTSLVGVIETCGKTLLDTIDHLLDHSKINNLSKLTSLNKKASKREPSAISPERDPQTTTFDLSQVVEEVVEAVFAGQTFRKTRLREHDSVDQIVSEIRSIELDEPTPTEKQIHDGSAKFSGRVTLLLDIQKSTSWWLQGQLGALRRVILNIVNNGIKYTEAGSIAVSLRSKPTSSSTVQVEFSVKDTGIGMSQEFLDNHLFQAFSQEDPFKSGTGLGLSITSQIVKNMGGTIQVDSEKHVGTRVLVCVPMKVATPDLIHGAPRDIIHDALKVTSGKKVCLLNPKLERRPRKDYLAFGSSLATIFREWFEMTVVERASVDDQEDTSIFVYAEPPPIEYLVQQHLNRKEMGVSGKEAALIVICTNAFEAAALRAAGIRDLVALGSIVEAISQPVGIRKLAKVLLRCIHRTEAGIWNEEDPEDARTAAPLTPFTDSQSRQHASRLEWKTLTLPPGERQISHRPAPGVQRWKSEPLIPRWSEVQNQTQGASDTGNPKTEPTSSQPAGAPPTGDSNDRSRRLPNVLVVDDNTINLKLLVTFMKKINLPYAQATNGLEAVTEYKKAERPFDFVLMDLQMPVMDGMEATRAIREFEQKQHGTGDGDDESCKPSVIIAITGVGSEDTRKEAMAAGMSDYLTKPVRFKDLQRRLLEQD